MELVSLMAGLPHSSKPACTCPVIAGYVRRMNDHLGRDREILRPYLPMLIGTVSDEHAQIRFESAFQSVLGGVLATALELENRSKLAQHVRELAHAKDFAAVATLLRSVNRKTAWLCRALYKLDSIIPYGAVEHGERLSMHRVWCFGDLVRAAYGDYKNALQWNDRLLIDTLECSAMYELTAVVIGVFKLTPRSARKYLLPKVLHVLDTMINAGPHGSRQLSRESSGGLYRLAA
jgi:hypothetical protein